MTEDEAKQNRCPVVPVIVVDVQAYIDHPDVIEKLGRCVGSRCNAWRGTKKAQPEQRAINRRCNPDYDRHDPFCREPEYIDTPGELMSAEPAEGYCGLAGKP